ncbi:hypothetical protein C8R46DRAFT_1236696 [Mycena filopes]|nr:hypothetical protein C8R46DRAFT_1236696 [Mycena filopes]
MVDGTQTHREIGRTNLDTFRLKTTVAQTSGRLPYCVRDAGRHPMPYKTSGDEALVLGAILPVQAVPVAYRLNKDAVEPHSSGQTNLAQSFNGVLVRKTMNIEQRNHHHGHHEVFDPVPDPGDTDSLSQLSHEDESPGSTVIMNATGLLDGEDSELANLDVPGGGSLGPDNNDTDNSEVQVEPVANGGATGSSGDAGASAQLDDGVNTPSAQGEDDFSASLPSDVGGSTLATAD